MSFALNLNPAFSMHTLIKSQLTLALLALGQAHLHPRMAFIKAMLKNNPKCAIVLFNENLPGMTIEEFMEMSDNGIIQVQSNAKDEHKKMASLLRYETACATIILNDDLRSLNETSVMLGQTLFPYILYFCYDCKSNLNFVDEKRILPNVLQVEQFHHDKLSSDAFSICSRCKNGLDKCQLWTQGSTEPIQPPCQHTLKNGQMNVNVEIIPPNIIYDPESNAFTGLDVEVIHHIGQWFGMSINLFPQEMDKNRENPLTIGPLGTCRRNCDYTSITYASTLIFITPKIKPLNPMLNIVRSFSPVTWFFLLATVLLVMFISSFIFAKRDKSIWVLNIFKSLLAQGIELNSSQSSLIVFLGSWFIFCAFINFSYDCNLRASLIKIPYEKPIDTAADLLRTGTQLYLPDAENVKSTFRNSPNEAMRKVYERAVEQDTVFKYVMNGMDPVKEKDLVFNVEARLVRELGAYDYLAYIEEKYKVQPFRMSSKPVVVVQTTYSLTKYNPWREELIYAVNYLYDMGLFGYLSRDFIKKLPPQEQNDLISLTIEHIMAAIIVLALGSFLALSVLISEILYARAYN